jgi:large subunit ribosomal protein L1
MTTKENFLKAVQELRKTDKKRNFNQTVDLIINLKNFNVKRDTFNIFVQLPNKIKDKKVAGFFEKKSNFIDTITKDDFARYKEKKDIKKIISKYDAFIANAKLMPAIATTFGRVLGPAGKMPSPQLGIIPSEDEKAIKPLVTRINSNVRVIVKEPSIKIGIGKESLNDEEIAENAVTAYNKILDNLPKKYDNIRNVEIKLSMGKTVAVGS